MSIYLAETYRFLLFVNDKLSISQTRFKSLIDRGLLL